MASFLCPETDCSFFILSKTQTLTISQKTRLRNTTRALARIVLATFSRSRIGPLILIGLNFLYSHYWVFLGTPETVNCTELDSVIDWMPAHHKKQATKHKVIRFCYSGAP